MRVGFYFVWGTTDVRVLEVSKARRARHGELWARARARALSGIAAGLVVFFVATSFHYMLPGSANPSLTGAVFRQCRGS